MAVVGFLDSTISQVIVQATENSQLQKDFDINLLKTLFMIKYVKEIRANIDNLTTLSISNIDEDRVALKQQVEKSLERLERQTLIQRNGDEYEFLTHEEQDIGREIKNTQVESARVISELQKLVWDSIFTDKKLRYQRNQYEFNRKLDETNSGKQISDLTLHIVTPYAETYGTMQDDNVCMVSTGTGYEVLVRLPDEQRLIDDLDIWVKTKEYINRKTSSSLTPSIQSILRKRGDENSKRSEDIKTILEDLISRADVFACGSKVNVSNRDAKNVLNEGLNYLVRNVYKKLDYVKSGFENEDHISNALTCDCEDQDIYSQPGNGPARSEMQTWLRDETRLHRQVTIRALRDKFAGRPYGWSELDTLGIMAELANTGKVELRHAQGNVNLRESGLVAQIRSKKGIDEYTVRIAEEIDPASLKIAKDMANELLNITPPADPQLLFNAYQEAFKNRRRELSVWLQQAEAGLPFASLLQSNLQFLDDFLAKDSPADFFRMFRPRRDDIEDYIEDSDKLNSFFTNQIKVFQKASDDLKTLEPQLRHINDQNLLQQVESVKRILAMSDPTSKIPQLPTLLKPVQEKVKEVLRSQIYQVQTKSKSVCDEVSKYITSAYQEVSGELDITSITQEVNRVVADVNNAATIDSVIARESELERMKAQIFERVDKKATEIVQRQAKTNNDTPPVVKPIVAVKVANVTPKSVLETPQDVDDYLKALRDALLDKIQQNNRVRLE